MAAKLPKLIVFDLDMCAWFPEMYSLSSIPKETVPGDLNGHGIGAVAALSGRHEVRLFHGALHAFQQLHLGKLPGVKAALASSADNATAVTIAKKCLELLEVVPGVTIAQVLASPECGFDTHQGHIQIGRERPLTSDKARTHFPFIREATGIDYSGMLFFDDSNWDDNCANVERNCPGVVTQRTPNGMTVAEFEQGLESYAQRYAL